VPVPAGIDDQSFARRVLDEAGVVVLPGSTLGRGGSGYFRVALTQSEERLREGARRLAPFSSP